jgi:hypothetical protein
MSEQVRFLSHDGASISVTSHRGDDDDRFARTRSWAPVNPYLSTQRGQVVTEKRDRSAPGPPEDLEWSETTIVVDNRETPFEITELGEGVWVAVGRVTGTIISIDSLSVPSSAVRLQRLTDDRIPPPPRPELGGNGDAVLNALDRRFEMIPFHRIRRSADYWALLDVETEHVETLAREQHLSGQYVEVLHQYWNERIEVHLANTLEGLHRSRMLKMHHSRVARRSDTGSSFNSGSTLWVPGRERGLAIVT